MDQLVPQHDDKHEISFRELSDHSITHMYFTPEVYRRAVALSHTNLKIVDTFFVDESGAKLTREWDNWEDPLDDRWKAAAILQKLP